MNKPGTVSKHIRIQILLCFNFEINTSHFPGNETFLFSKNVISREMFSNKEITQIL